MKKLKHLVTAIAIIGVFACLQSCKSDDNNSYQMDDQTFVNQATSSNDFEVQAGTLATTRSQNTLVQTFGSKMVNEHTTVGKDLSAIATSKDLNVPSDLQQKEQNNLSTLNSLSGDQFDAQFVNMMILSHQDAISLFESASSNTGVRDGDLRNFAANKLPSLKEHLKEAQALQAQLSL